MVNYWDKYTEMRGQQNVNIWISVFIVQSWVIQWGHAVARAVSTEFRSGSARVRCLTKWHCEEASVPKLRFSPVSIIPPILLTDLTVKLVLSEETRTKPGNPQYSKDLEDVGEPWKGKFVYTCFFENGSVPQEWDTHQEYPQLHTYRAVRSYKPAFFVDGECRFKFWGLSSPLCYPQIHWHPTNLA